jgi:hypothetical protein
VSFDFDFRFVINQLEINQLEINNE